MLSSSELSESEDDDGESLSLFFGLPTDSLPHCRPEGEIIKKPSLSSITRSSLSFKENSDIARVREDGASLSPLNRGVLLGDRFGSFFPSLRVSKLTPDNRGVAPV
jgi:hypothetical protein